MIIKKSLSGYQNLKLKYKLIFLFSLVCIATLTIFSSISMTFYKSLITKNESQAMLENLDFFKVNLDNYLENIEAFSASVILSKDIQDTIGVNLDTLESEERLQAYNRVYNRIHELNNNTNGIRSIYILDKYKNIFSLDLMMDTSSPFVNGGELKNQAWYDKAVKLEGAPYWTILDWYNGKKLIGMVQTIKNMNNIYEKSNIGISLITISPNMLNYYFEKNRINEGIYCIIDDNHKVYTNTSASQIGEIIDISEIKKGDGYYIEKMEGKEYVITYSFDPMTNWTFAHVIDRSFLLKDVKYINKVWILVFVISFLMVVFISIFISGSVSKPLNKLVMLIKEVEKGNLNIKFNNLFTDEIGSLGGSFNRMVNRIREGIPLKREKFLRALLVGSLTEEEYLQEKEDINISLNNDTFQVVIIHAEEDISDDINKQIENKLVTYENNQHSIISTTLKNGEYCIISDRKEEDTYFIIKEIVSDIKESLNINTVAFSGNTYDNIHFIKNSFEEAKELLRYKFFKTSNLEFINHKFIINNSWEVSYPDQIENKLIYCIEQSNLGGCKEILGESVEFFKQNNTDPSIINTFIFNLYMRLFKVAVKNGRLPSDVFGKDFWSIENLQYMSQPIEKIFEDLMGTIDNFFTVVKSSNNANMNLNIRKAVEIIKEEYGNPMLGVEYVAEKICLNDNYFSRLFKKELDISFIDYVSRIRLEKAKVLLKDSNTKIKDISSKVGFSDSHYFAIWFKDNSGVTPSQYRKQ